MSAELFHGRDRATERSSVTDAVALRDGLAGLAAMVSESLSLPQVLDRVTILAAGATPAADGVGVVLTGMQQEGRPVRAGAASAAFVSQIDMLQRPTHAVHASGGSLPGSPSASAAIEGLTICTGSVAEDPRWPWFGSEVSRLGVRSVLSLPLVIGKEVIGVIDAYAREPNAFDERAAAHGESFAAAAAVVVHNAGALDQAELLAAQLRTALVNRPIIDQAVGVLRSRSGQSAKECFELLRTASRAENVKIAVVAERVVREAVRRAGAVGPDS